MTLQSINHRRSKCRLYSRDATINWRAQKAISVLGVVNEFQMVQAGYWKRSMLHLQELNIKIRKKNFSESQRPVKKRFKYMIKFQWRCTIFALLQKSRYLLTSNIFYIDQNLLYYNFLLDDEVRTSVESEFYKLGGWLNNIQTQRIKCIRIAANIPCSLEKIIIRFVLLQGLNIRVWFSDGRNSSVDILLETYFTDRNILR